MKVSSGTKRWLSVLAGVVSIGLVTGLVAQAAISRSAPISRFDGVDEIVEKCTNATSFVNMPQMKTTFTLGGGVNDEVAAMFQGSLRLDDSGGAFDTGFLRLTVDGQAQSPGDVPALAPGDRGTHGFNWQTEPLTPGSHEARVQWRTDLGGELCVDARSLIVLHK